MLRLLSAPVLCVLLLAGCAGTRHAVDASQETNVHSPWVRYDDWHDEHPVLGGLAVVGLWTTEAMALIAASVAYGR